jgi:hypothetical protein
MEEVKPDVPMVVRLVGTNAKKDSSLADANDDSDTCRWLRKLCCCSGRIKMSILINKGTPSSGSRYYGKRRIISFSADARLRAKYCCRDDTGKRW